MCSGSFPKLVSHEGLVSHSVCDMLVPGYYKNDDSVGPEKLLASSHPLSEVEDGTCATTESIRGVLVTTLFILMIPGRAEKAAEKILLLEREKQNWKRKRRGCLFLHVMK